MIPTEIDRLACAIHALRVDWPAASLRTFITNNLASKPYQECALALAWIATDSTTKTPARVLEAGPWWTNTNVERNPIPMPPRYTPERVDIAAPDYASAAAERIRQTLKGTNR